MFYNPLCILGLPEEFLNVQHSLISEMVGVGLNFRFSFSFSNDPDRQLGLGIQI